MATDIFYLIRKKDYNDEGVVYPAIFQINGKDPSVTAPLFDDKEVLTLVEAKILAEVSKEKAQLQQELHQVEEDSKAERESPMPKWSSVLATDVPSKESKDWSGIWVVGILLACLVSCGIYTRCAHVEELEVKEHTTARQQICASLLTVIHQEVAQRKASCQQQVQRKAYLYAAAKNKLNKDEAALLPEPPDLFICDQMVNDSAVEDECFNFVNLYPGIGTLMHH